MSAYYNELDKFAAAWLRELIKAGLIADGEVDERSIADVRPDDLRGFTQCHFFAGIGGWSYALRLAGWPDERAVWTGSCPCQPFSTAGAQAGGGDSRDLWPTWYQLIRQCRPVCLFGEQVEAANRHGWLDRLCDDLEGEGYAVGAVCLPGPCVGAYDIRQRLWFVADAECGTTKRHGFPLEITPARAEGATQERERIWTHAWDGCHLVPVADSARGRFRIDGSASRDAGHVDECDTAGELGDAESADGRGEQQAHGEKRWRAGSSGAGASGFWWNAEWIDCTDGKARPVEPGTFPLAYGIPERVGRLRGYGNAIKPQVAQVFIEAYMSCGQ